MKKQRKKKVRERERESCFAWAFYEFIFFKYIG